MAEATKVYSGDLIPYTSTGAATSDGDIVNLGSGLHGVVQGDIEADADGTVSIAGGYDVYKDSADAEAFAVGDAVAWHPTDNKARTSGTTGAVDMGICLEAAAAGDSKVRVGINR